MSRNSDIMLAMNQIASQLGSVSQAFAPAGSNLGKLGEAVENTSRAAIMQENLKRQREEERKARKKSQWGNIGSTIGMIGGTMLAPMTGGASLAATAAMAGAGSAAGGMIGSAAGGGMDSGRIVGDFAGGAMGGATSHIGGQMLSGMGMGGSTAAPRMAGTTASGAPNTLSMGDMANNIQSFQGPPAPAPPAMRPPVRASDIQSGGFFNRLGQTVTNMGVARNPMAAYGAGIMAPQFFQSGSDPNRRTIYFPGM